MTEESTAPICYIPTVRWITGERRAFQREIALNVKAIIKPLIEIPARSEKHDEPDENDELMGAATPEDFLQALPLNIIHAWGMSPFLLDAHFTEQSFMASSSLAYLCETLNEYGGKAVPVFRLDSVAKIAEGVKPHAKHGVGLRLSALQAARSSDIRELMKRAGAEPETTDVIFDLGYIAPTSVDITASFLEQPAFFDFAMSEPWRSVTLLGGSFPQSITGLTPGLHSVPRIEWTFWKEVMDRADRRILFGDYTVGYPTPQPPTGEIRQSIPCIRYTAPDDWLLFRGAGKKQASVGGNKQYHTLAKLCREHEAFRKRDYSAGDRYVDDCADKKDGPGNPTRWRRASTSIHVTYVAEQASNALGSAGMS